MANEREWRDQIVFSITCSGSIGYPYGNDAPFSLLTLYTPDEFHIKCQRQIKLLGKKMSTL